MTEFFAILHLPSNQFLPAPEGNRGGTWMEPSSTSPPRLFCTARGAKIALRFWLKGPMQRVCYGDFDEGYFDVVPYLKPRPGTVPRQSSDMAVVRVNVAVIDR